MSWWQDAQQPQNAMRMQVGAGVWAPGGRHASDALQLCGGEIAAAPPTWLRHNPVGPYIPVHK